MLNSIKAYFLKQGMTFTGQVLATLTPFSSQNAVLNVELPMNLDAF